MNTSRIGASQRRGCVAGMHRLVAMSAELCFAVCFQTVSQRCRLDLFILGKGAGLVELVGAGLVELVTIGWVWQRFEDGCRKQVSRRVRLGGFFWKK